MTKFESVFWICVIIILMVSVNSIASAPVIQNFRISYISQNHIVFLWDSPKKYDDIRSYRIYMKENDTNEDFHLVYEGYQCNEISCTADIKRLEPMKIYRFKYSLVTKDNKEHEKSKDFVCATRGMRD